MALNDAKVKAAKPAEKDYKLADSGQLYLLVSKAGGRLWRMNYTFGRSAKDPAKPAQKTLALGAYPAMTLGEARTARDAARKLIIAGKDPAVERRVQEKVRAVASSNTFQIVAERWFELKTGWSVPKYRKWCADNKRAWKKADAGEWIVRPNGGWSLVHSGDVLRSLDRDVFPEIGHVPITDIDSPKLLEVLNAIEARGAIETAHRVCQRISDIYIYAIPAGLAKANPAASLSKALQKVPRGKKQPSIVDGIEDNGDQLRAIRQLVIDCEAERCRAVTKFALRLMALTATRPNELHGAAWEEMEDIQPRFGVLRGERVQINRPVWRIPSARMKGDEERKVEEFGDHVVPLSTHAVEVIETLRRLTGNYRLLFPGERHVHEPISENTIRDLLIRAGYRGTHVPHGFRAAFSTIMNGRPKGDQGRHDGDRAVIDLMLAHVPKDKVEGAYNRAAHMDRRRELAQQWGDVLVGGMWGPEVQLGLPIRHGCDTRNRWAA